MDQTQLPQDFGLFRTFFYEDYPGSSEHVKMWYKPPKNGKNSTAQDFRLFRSFFAKDYIKSSEEIKML